MKHRLGNFIIVISPMKWPKQYYVNIITVNTDLLDCMLCMVVATDLAFLYPD